ncbi:Kinase, CAMK CAMKL [Spironucleus salmonicida]|uniref:Kinase, CAMK CAMKL n=1 Tax=Spironucleus salmonicida TaxID=348837 RepID=V6LV92_9EUKA|nr:Kinase, CAMK CAMKL [Spironucleus salmonicida]|eukprot:EST48562.1 Kinase, CAMK CAMKL [Spironucleus salmonicida]
MSEEEDNSCAIVFTNTANFETVKEKAYLNQYRLDRYLQSGAEASVFMATDVHSMEPQQYAILSMKNDIQCQKRIDIHKEINGTPNIVFLKEVITPDTIDTSRLTEKFAKEYADILQKDRIFLVTSYFEGSDCFTFLKQQRPNVILRVFRNICEAVVNIHEQCIFHFDLKPDNILLSRTGEVCLIDFGAAQVCDSQHINIIDPLISEQVPTTVVFMKTPKFAPIFATDCVIAEKFDVYSLGCILYLVLTRDYCPGEIQRHGKTTLKLNANFGPLITDLLNGMLEIDQSLRYSMDNVLNHIVFEQNSMFPPLIQLRSFHTRILMDLRDYIVQTEIAKSVIRPRSVCKSRGLIKFMSTKESIRDDQGFLYEEKSIRQDIIPMNYKYFVSQQCRMQGEIQDCLGPEKHLRFRRYLRIMQRLDQFICYLQIYREFLQNQSVMPSLSGMKHEYLYGKGSVFNRTSTYLQQEFHRQTQDDEASYRPSHAEFTVDYENSSGNVKRKRWLNDKQEQPQSLNMQISVQPGIRDSQSEFLGAIPPPLAGGLGWDDDIFGNQNDVVNIEMSSSNANQARKSTLGRRSTVNRNGLGSMFKRDSVLK